MEGSLQDGPLKAIVLAEDTIREEKVHGVEMTHRTITREEKELAAAGYEHLVTPRKDQKTDSERAIEIYEHSLPFEGLSNELKTSFNLKEPGHSFGLTSDEAKVRRSRDGPNMISPPKKKSALRKVCPSRKPSFCEPT